MCAIQFDDEALRLAVYRTFATAGRAPTATALGEEFGVPAEEVVAGLHRLHDARHLVLGRNDRIVLAHPFSDLPMGFAVMGRETLWWGGCAWCSMAIAHVVAHEPEVLVSTRCPNCGGAHAWVVDRDGPPQGDEVAHFLKPVERMWDDVVETCTHQRIFCNRACVDSWLRTSRRELGYVMDLSTLWHLARHWFDGRTTYGYTRREPEEARAYFREVGLSGPFWGL